MRGITPYIFGVALAMTSLARGASTPFTLTTADFAHREVRLESINADGVVVVDVMSGARQTIPVAAVVELRRPTSSVAVDGWFALRTRDGQRLICKPTAIRDDVVSFTTPNLGNRTIPIGDVASIVLASLPDNVMPATQQDELRLANGDQIRGIVSGSDAKNVTCQTPDGQSVAVAWANVQRIHFAETQATTARTVAFNVRLGDGTVVRATQVSLAGETATLSLATGDVVVPVASVAAIEHLDGDAQMLAWITPTSATYESYFPVASVAGSAPNFVDDPIAADAYSATTALTVRPKSTLRWAVPEGRRLHARVAVPAGRAFADVTIRVLDGDRVVFEKPHLKSGAAPLDVDVPLNGAGSVGLQVDYGEGFDVQDQIVWLDATLLRSDVKNEVK